MSLDWLQWAMLGTTLQDVRAYEHGWSFGFANGGGITTQSFWRVLAHGGIAVTSEDHDQKFGLPEPVDAGHRAQELLRGPVSRVELLPITSDLRLEFDGKATLELFNTSSGYEGWHLGVPTADGQKELVALGGGDAAMWRT